VPAVSLGVHSPGYETAQVGCQLVGHVPVEVEIYPWVCAAVEAC